eukprot:scaffold31699_cov25-Tisochrysis_lutea.AAC.2
MKPRANGKCIAKVEADLTEPSAQAWACTAAAPPWNANRVMLTTLPVSVSTNFRHHTRPPSIASESRATPW